MASFLHGVEKKRIDSGARPINVVESAVIGLIGTAPIYQVDSSNQKINQPQLILNEVDAARYFGTKESGYTIPEALDSIFDQGAGPIIVINVFNPATHKTAVVDEAKTFGTDNKLTLAHKGVNNVVVKNTGGTTTYVLDTDYSVDTITGVITRKTTGGNITAGQSVKVSYDYADVTKVTNPDIIGVVDVSGNKTGLKAFKDCFTKMGISPKILIAPVFHTIVGVASELEILADNINAFGYIDAPVGTTFQQAIEGRGPEGTINFNFSSNRIMLCYPHAKKYDEITDTEILTPYSSIAAGIRASVDSNPDKGFWHSISNKPIKGIIGLERPITFSLDDPNSEANVLNSKGILTIINDYGTGFRTWGNRSSAFPAAADVETFECVKRTGDIIDESIRKASLQFIDGPIDKIFTDTVTQSVDNFLRYLKGIGALIDGKCWYDPAKNSAEEIAKGHVVFSRSFISPIPAERITWEETVDVQLLKNIGA